MSRVSRIAWVSVLVMVLCLPPTVSWAVPSGAGNVLQIAYLISGAGGTFQDIFLTGVFPMPNGRLLAGWYLYRWVWHPVLDRAGVRRRPFHATRHSFATHLLELGQPVTYVAAQLGHFSPALTLKVCAHWIREPGIRAVDVLDPVSDATICNARATVPAVSNDGASPPSIFPASC